MSVRISIKTPPINYLVSSTDRICVFFCFAQFPFREDKYIRSNMDRSMYINKIPMHCVPLFYDELKTRVAVAVLLHG